MQSFQFIGLTPPRRADPSIAIAASRAGELGVLNLEHVQNEISAHQAIVTMSRHAHRVCGIRLGDGSATFVEGVTRDLPEHVSVVILTAQEPQALARRVVHLRNQQRTVYLEVTCLEQACLGRDLGVDGLIAKGSEAGGWVGEETAFILLQHLLSEVDLPVWAYGGIGPHTAAACYAAGAAGAVLDWQLTLTRECQLPEAVETAIAAMDGSETVCLGEELGRPYRIYSRPGLPVVEELREMATDLARQSPRDKAAITWRHAVEERVGWDSAAQHVWPIGQDASLAAALAKRYRTVGGVLVALREAVQDHIAAVCDRRPLDQHAPLARSHGTRYPIVQGPMTRVSDRVEFALCVAERGALPFLALGMMRAPEAEALLDEAQRRLGELPWGVGILGFVSPELRQEQIRVIRQHNPPFALIAGGRPDQARALERENIATYLHVPSPELLRLFLEDGARRFVLEGRECGGHVGPRSSFVLWESAVQVLLDRLPPDEMTDCHVLFAGGIHDARSASMVAALAAPLAERGAKLGVLLGTAYLFTEEAVASGAILPAFQKEALHCSRTVLLETGPGHAVRCVPTPYVDLFEREKRRLVEEGRPPDEVRRILEDMNVGRLRIASKGIARHSRYRQDPDVPKFIRLDEEEQRTQGMYMIGQLAALRKRACAIEDLHREVAIEGSRRLEELSYATQSASVSLPTPHLSQIAIVGMSCILPKAPDLRRYWANILSRVNAITEIPQDRWDWHLYYDPDRRAKDRAYSKWGGFIDDVPFDPVEFGMPPNSLSSIDPMQLLALKTAQDALKDAGYLGRPLDRSRVSVILGASGGLGDLGAAYVLRSCLPLLLGEAAPELIAQSDGILPEWTEDSFAGILLNVTAGRISNRLDLGGMNYVVDAACASSLTAVRLAVRELEVHSTDMVITGGVDTVQSPFGYMCFSKTQALSPTGEARTFDATADGIVIGEGIVMLVLKRLADAQRDGDRIYAVIQAVAGSSDGRAMGLTAPRPEGQKLALRRAYAEAGVSPLTVSLFEAHGTGTVVGDRAEALALSTFLEENGASPQSSAIGSVKTMIGHTKATAGVAGLAKAALALYHKVLPPTLGVTQPNPKALFGDGPLYVNSETRPWLHGLHEHPRRAGVSAFGFGGTNFHAVVEEYTGEFLPEREAVLQDWPSELFLWSASTRERLLATLSSLEQTLDRGACPRLADLAYSLYLAFDKGRGRASIRLAIVASCLDDLGQKLARSLEILRSPDTTQVSESRGLYLSDRPLAVEGKVAFLFPGQGSQYPNMLRDLAIHFASVRETFEQADRVLQGQLPKPLSSYIFPPPAFGADEERARQQELTKTDIAQPALGAAEMALYGLFGGLGMTPDLVAGHSYGEYCALCAAGVFDLDTLVLLSEARGRSILRAAEGDLGTMAAVRADAETIAPILEAVDGVWIANLNTPRQTIISGTTEGITKAVELLKTQKMRARSIAVSCGFHSPLVAPARDLVAECLSRGDFAPPAIDVYSNTTAAQYPREPEAIRSLLTEHLVRPIRFVEEIEAMYTAGSRVFVEIGPRNVVSSLVGQILRERPHVAVPTDLLGQCGLGQLQKALGELGVHGLPLQLDLLYRGREVRCLDLDALELQTGKALSPTTWLVNGGRARPLHAPVTPPRRAIRVRPGPEKEGEGLPGSTATSLEQPRDVEPEASTVTRPGAHLASVQPLATSLGDETGEVMTRFQQLMGRFLEMQRNVMLSYLRGSPMSPTVPGGLERSEPASAGAPSPVTSALSPIEDSVEAGQSAASQEPTGAPSPRQGATGSELVTADGLLDRTALTTHLLAIVSERTGYPPDMLDLDLDLEAALGIDSIKRVEILGQLRQSLSDAGWAAQALDMDRLSDLKTLREVIDEFAAHGDQSPDTKVSVCQHEALSGVAGEGEGSASQVRRAAPTAVERLTLRAVSRALSPSKGQLAPGHVVLLTDDGAGVAAELRARLRDEGYVAEVLMPLGGAQAEQGIYEADLTSRDDVERVLGLIRREHGPVAGLIHLLPLRACTSFDDMDLPAWRHRLALETRSLFLLARALRTDLEAAAEAGGAAIVSALGMGGSFGSDPPASSTAFFPGQGAISGLLKTLAKEWPAVRVKAVDLDARQPPSTLAGQILSELMADDAQVEVGYQNDRRLVLQTVPAPFTSGSDLTIGEDSVLLVTGGARGITADAALELARRYRSTFVLVGRSPLPDAEEEPDTVGIDDPRELKAVLIERLRSQGETPTPVEVERTYESLLKAREIRHNLAAFAEAGARVEYHSVNVRDEQTFGGLVDEIYHTFGRLDGVIHGAGIIEDKLLKDKTLESFERVFSTKTESAFILSRHLRPDSLRFLVFFSSVAGRFGNRGQSDYTAANEVLNKLAIYLDRRWASRVVSINWGPWEKRGMVSSELQREFARRGVALIPVAEGQRWLEAEIRRGRKGEAEVIIGNEP